MESPPELRPLSSLFSVLDLASSNHISVYQRIDGNGVPPRCSPCLPTSVYYLRMHTNTKHNNRVENMMRLMPRALIRHRFSAFSVTVMVGAELGLSVGGSPSVGAARVGAAVFSDGEGVIVSSLVGAGVVGIILILGDGFGSVTVTSGTVGAGVGSSVSNAVGAGVGSVVSGSIGPPVGSSVSGSVGLSVGSSVSSSSVGLSVGSWVSNGGRYLVGVTVGYWVSPGASVSSMGGTRSL